MIAPRSIDGSLMPGEKRSGIAPENKEPQSNPAGRGIPLCFQCPRRFAAFGLYPSTCLNTKAR
jgi:hypothetical protein